MSMAFNGNSDDRKEHMKPYGYTLSLKEFLSKFFPGIDLFQDEKTNSINVHLNENPERLRAEKAVEEAWERNRYE